MLRSTLLAVLCACLAVVLQACSSKPTTMPVETGRHDSKLLLVLIADQFPTEFLDRFSPVINGGLRTLLENGVFFDQAYYQIAYTATCPGHSVLSTGLFPSRTGIIGNYWFDREERKGAYCVGDPKYSRSPRNLLVTALPDWMKEANPLSKAYAASGKDRAAIMMGGKRPDGAYWYDKKKGVFTSSRYYQRKAPKWVDDFNKKHLLWDTFGTSWAPIEDMSSKYRRLEIKRLDEGVYARNFPHALGSLSVNPKDSYYGAVYRSPFVDEYLFEFAEELIVSEGLGNDEHIDYLALSLSAHDTVGHDFGPNSPEVLDTLLRLDRNLQTFLDFVDQRIGLSNVTIAFSSDHGILPLPEYQSSVGRKGHRVDTNDIQCVQQAAKRLAEKLGSKDLVLADGYFNTKELEELGLDVAGAARMMREVLSQCEFIEYVWLPSEIAKMNRESADRFALQYANNFFRERSPDYIVQPKEFHLASKGRGTNHGSPYDYDSHVPIILVDPMLTPSRSSELVRPVDLAPTLAKLIGISTPDELDGRNLLRN